MGHFPIRYHRIRLSDQFRILNIVFFRNIHENFIYQIKGVIKKIFHAKIRKLMHKLN